MITTKKEDDFKANLWPVLATILPKFQKDNNYAIDKDWFDKFTAYVVTDTNDKPGKIDHNTIIGSRNEDGVYTLKPGLVIFQDYVLLSKESWLKLEAAFGFIRFSEWAA